MDGFKYLNCHDSGSDKAWIRGDGRAYFAGTIGVGMIPTLIGLDVSVNYNSWGAQLQNVHSSSPYGLTLYWANANPDNNTNIFLNCQSSGGQKCIIYSDGDLANHDGTYGTISDVKLKQDIVDARSYWDDFKRLQYRKFRNKDDVLENANAPYRLGLVAQEVETIFPALAPESPDQGTQRVPEKDADGNNILDEDGEVVTKGVSVDLGTTTKWVRSSIIEGPIMGRVVQELQARLEAAEAKIVALEAA